MGKSRPNYSLTHHPLPYNASPCGSWLIGSDKGVVVEVLVTARQTVANVVTPFDLGTYTQSVIRPSEGCEIT